MPMQRYTGGCHCGNVRFECDADLSRLTRCTCSICSKKGLLHALVAPEHFRLLGGAECLTTYRFGTRTAQHPFCAACGVQPFTRPRLMPHMYAVNVRCLDDVDLAGMAGRIGTFDGRNWEQAVAALRARPA